MRLAIIGYGQMGQALASRWFTVPDFQEILLIKRGFAENPPINLPQHVQTHTDVAFLANWPADVVVLAVKPQQMETVLAGLQPFLPPQVLLITVAAALPIQFYLQALPHNQAVVRVMPNTPSQIGQGMNAGFANSSVTDKQRQLIERLFALVGKWAWVTAERQLDIVAAISGSGPAYYFLFTELLAQWGCQQGLNAELAEQLARQTLIGSGALMAATEQASAILRQAVTSKGGITAAALNILQTDDALADLMAKALDANLARGLEMAQTYA